MQCTISVKAFKKALDLVAKFAPKKGRTPKPILANVLLRADGENGSTLSATNLEHAIRHGVSGIYVDEPGAVLLPVDKLKDILKSTKDEQLAIETTDGGTVVKSTRTQWTLAADDVDLYPDFSEHLDRAASIAIGSEMFAQAIHRTHYATDEESTRFALDGLLLEFGGDYTFNVVATDGRRLALQHGDFAPIGSITDAVLEPLILPVATAKLLESIANANDGEWVGIALRPKTENGGAFVFHIGQTTIYTRAHEGRFPRYADVFPGGYDTAADFPAPAVLSEALEQVAPFTDGENRGVDFDLYRGSLEVTTTSAENGKVTAEARCGQDGPSRRFTMDCRYVLDMLGALRVSKKDAGPALRFLIVDHKNPLTFKTADGFTYLVMPLTRDDAKGEDGKKPLPSARETAETSGPVGETVDAVEATPEASIAKAVEESEDVFDGTTESADVPNGTVVRSNHNDLLYQVLGVYADDSHANGPMFRLQNLADAERIGLLWRHEFTILSQAAINQASDIVTYGQCNCGECNGLMSPSWAERTDDGLLYCSPGCKESAESRANPVTPPAEIFEAPAPTAEAEPRVILIGETPYGMSDLGTAWDGARTVRLEKGDSRGTVYDCVQTADGATVCECRDFTVRRAGLDTAGCKHIKALRASGLFSAYVPTPHEDDRDTAAPEPVTVGDETADAIEPAAPEFTEPIDAPEGEDVETPSWRFSESENVAPVALGLGSDADDSAWKDAPAVGALEFAGMAPICGGSDAADSTYSDLNDLTASRFDALRAWCREQPDDDEESNDPAQYPRSGFSEEPAYPRTLEEQFALWNGVWDRRKRRPAKPTIQRPRIRGKDAPSCPAHSFGVGRDHPA